MTERKHFKKLVRSRSSSISKRAPHHYPGSIPAAAALRALLSHASIRNPRSRAPFSEAMVFGIAASRARG